MKLWLDVYYNCTHYIIKANGPSLKQNLTGKSIEESKPELLKGNNDEVLEIRQTCIR